MPLDSTPERPLYERLALLLIYSGGLGAFLLRRRKGTAAGELPERVDAADLALTAVATHKVARTIAKDKITAPLREPFTEYEGEADTPSEERTRPVEQGRIRRGIGELISCPYCLDVWVGTAFAAGMVEVPRHTRFVAGVLTAVTASDFLQVIYRKATE